jgi:thiamine-phosphate pyrophosphorylase
VLITDRVECRTDFVAAIRAALAGGVSAVVLRERDLDHDDLVAAGRPLAEACREADALFLVNHDVAAAAALRADGVHLGFRSVSIADARAIVGEDAFIGRSTHDGDELQQALDGGADYVTFGPIFDTPSKRGLLDPRGVGALTEAVRRAGTAPVLALGGVTAENVAELRRAGAAGVACIREILAADDVAAAARRLVAAWDAAA